MLTFCRIKISKSEEHVDADEAPRFTELETPVDCCELWGYTSISGRCFQTIHKKQSWTCETEAECSFDDNLFSSNKYRHDSYDEQYMVSVTSMHEGQSINRRELTKITLEDETDEVRIPKLKSAEALTVGNV